MFQKNLLNRKINSTLNKSEVMSDLEKNLFFKLGLVTNAAGAYFFFSFFLAFYLYSFIHSALQQFGAALGVECFAQGHSDYSC